MELYQLKTFLGVIEAGTLARASTLLHTSQPAISAQIKALEAELGVQLFRRTPRGMVLTEAGERLAGDAARVLDAAGTLQQHARQLGGELTGELRIGINTDADYLQIGRLYGRVRERHPHLQVHFVQSSSSGLVDDLRHGAVDAGFRYGSHAQTDISETRLREVPMSLCLPASAGHLRDAPLSELCHLPWLNCTSPRCPFFALADALFVEAGARPTQVAHVDTEETSRSLIRAGAGVAVMRASDADELEAAGQGVRWRGLTPTLSLNFATLARQQQDPAIRAFLAAASEVLSPA